LLSQPKAALIACGFLVGFALIPGFPKIPFFMLAALIGSIGYFQLRKARVVSAPPDKENLPAMAPAGQKVVPRRKDDGDEFSITVPLLVDVSASSQDMIDADSMNYELMRVRSALYHDLGVPFPGIHLRFNEALTTGNYKIMLHEVPVASGQLLNGYVLAREKPESLKMLGIEFQQAEPFLRGLVPLWVQESRRSDLDKARITYLQPTQVLTYHLSVILKRYASDFVGLQETKYLLEQMEKQFPEVVREVQRILPVQKIAEVFQRLVQEDISIRNLRTILSALIEWGQKEKEPVLLTEYVRSTLKRYVSYKFSRGQNILSVYLLEQDLEEKIRKAVRQTSAGAYLAMDPASVKAFLQSVRSQINGYMEANQRPVLLTSLDVRRYARKLIEQEFYELPVISYQELTEEIVVQPLGRIAG